ncbi:hypothetical protein ACUIJ5_28330 (plasmid) [Bacillus toyonensis]
MRILHSILIVFIFSNVILVTEIFLEKFYNNYVADTYTDSAILGTLYMALAPPFLLRAIFFYAISKYVYEDSVYHCLHKHIVVIWVTAIFDKNVYNNLGYQYVFNFIVKVR